MRPDIHTLTGAYALDALPEDERATFEEHLEVCEPCRQEVDELLATAARLGASLHDPPPPGLRAEVLAAIDQVRQVPPPPARAPAPVTRLPRWVVGVLAPAAAVLVVVGVALGVAVADLRGQVDELETTADRLAAVLAAPDAQDYVVAADGTSVRLVLSASRGEGVLAVDGMQPPPAGTSYEAWLIHDDLHVPAGSVDIDPEGHGTHLVTGDIATVTAVGVTVEPAAGPTEPSSDPVMLIDVAS